MKYKLDEKKNPWMTTEETQIYGAGRDFKFLDSLMMKRVELRENMWHIGNRIKDSDRQNYDTTERQIHEFSWQTGITMPHSEYHIYKTDFLLGMYASLIKK